MGDKVYLAMLEGMDGTGKDTIALELSKNGFLTFKVPPENFFPERKKYADTHLVTPEFHLSYYLDGASEVNNKIKEMRDQNVKIILIRSWLSTLVAQLALDNMQNNGRNYSEIIKKISEHCKDFCKPDIIFILDADINTRKLRVLKRGDDPANEIHTDFSKFTEIEYSKLDNTLAKVGITPKIVRVDTTNQSIADLSSYICKVIDKEILSQAKVRI